jgi:hypothetical protein
VRRTLLILAISTAVVVSGCSAAGTGQVFPPKGGLCESYVATAGQATPGPGRTDWFDKSIRTCRSLEQWETAVAAYAADAVGAGATTYLAERCAETSAGLGRYQLCGLLTISLATPTPAPTKKSKHKPKKTAKPKRTPAPVAAASPEPSPGASPALVVPSPVIIVVPTAPPKPTPI